MKKVCVKSLPLKDVIRDLADEFGTDYTEECKEYKLLIPAEHGQGQITGINFPSGLGIIIYDCQFTDDLEICFTINDIHPAKFLYVTEGQLDHSFEDEFAPHSISRYQSAIVASSGHNGHSLNFNKGERVKMSSLEIDRRQFQNHINCSISSLAPSLQQLLNDVNADATFYHEGDYSLYLADLFSEIEQFDAEGLVRELFLEGKSYQMLTHQIIQYEDDLNGGAGTQVLRRSELDKIILAMRTIQQELPNLDTVKELAARVGLNENKLQEGFRNLTGSTVNQYIQNARMDAAKELLISSDLSISEIVYSIGLSNRGYFSKVFKEKYQVSPSIFRNRRRSSEDDD